MDFNYEEGQSVGGLDDLSQINAPASEIQKDKKKKKKDKKDKKDKKEKKLKVKDFNNEGVDDDGDIDNAIQMQAKKRGNFMMATATEKFPKGENSEIDDRASAVDNASASGSRYVIGLKQGLKFYGDNESINQS